MKRLSKKQQDVKRRQIALEMTVGFLNAPRGSIESVSTVTLVVDFAESLLRMLGVDLDFSAIRQCGRCYRFYLRARANQASCSAACSAVLRQRKYVRSTETGSSVTGKRENTPRGKREAVI